MKLLSIITVTTFTFAINVGCKGNELANPCDPESDSYFTQLFLSSASESGFCLGQIVNGGNPYPFSEFTFYKSLPVNVPPNKFPLSQMRMVPPLPEGLFVDEATGSLRGSPTSATERTIYRVIRKGAEIAQISIEVRDMVATQVYGQFGSFSCGAPYNGGSCNLSGTPSASNLSDPRTLVTSENGEVYLATGNRVLYYAQGSNVASRVYGQHGIFNCDNANSNSNLSCISASISGSTLNSVFGVNLDSIGNLWISDSSNGRVLYFENGSNFPARALGVSNFSTVGGGGVSQNVMNQPRRIALGENGSIYISDGTDNRVLFIPRDASLPTEVWGQPNFASNGATLTNTGLNIPSGITVDRSGGLYVADTGNNRVLYFPKGSKTASRVYGQSSFNSSIAGVLNGLNSPEEVSLDQSENLFIADYNNSRIIIYPKTNETIVTQAVASIGQFGSLACGIDNNGGSCTSTSPTAQNLYRTTGVHFDRKGKLYVVDSGNHRVLAY